VCTGAVSLQFSRFQGHGFSSRQSEVIKLNVFPFMSKSKQKNVIFVLRKKKLGMFGGTEQDTRSV
jgi:hypothetical protein